MTARIDPIFVSHGAPTLALAQLPGEAELANRLKEVGRTMPKPKAILVASAHWSTEEPRVGGAVHKLRELAWKGGGATDVWAREFDDWLFDTLSKGRLEDAIAAAQKAPSLKRAHPSLEHLLPLYVALGAAGAGAKAEALH